MNYSFELLSKLFARVCGTLIIRFIENLMEKYKSDQERSLVSRSIEAGYELLKSKGTNRAVIIELVNSLPKPRVGGQAALVLGKLFNRFLTGKTPSQNPASVPTVILNLAPADARDIFLTHLVRNRKKFNNRNLGLLLTLWEFRMIFCQPLWTKIAQMLSN